LTIRTVDLAAAQVRPILNSDVVTRRPVWEFRVAAVPLAAIIGLGLAAGVLIGCIGIGGVVLVPALHYVGGVQIHTAIAAAMMAYLVSGVIGTMVFGNKQSIRWEMAPWLWAGAVPGALAGALAGTAAPGLLLELAIGLLAAVSGTNALMRRDSDNGRDGRHLPNTTLAAVGAIVGFGSSLTGTGGPLMLVPILLWLDASVLTAIGLAQAIQLPIAIMATAGNAAAGTLNHTLGALLGLGLAFGTWGGAHLAHALPRATLIRIVAVVLVAVGAAIVAQIALRLFG
jgi:hypothetical protein